MAGPMQMYEYIHDAILREVAELEVMARELNRDDTDEIAALTDRINLFFSLARKHEDTEEEALELTYEFYRKFWDKEDEPAAEVKPKRGWLRRLAGKLFKRR